MSRWADETGAALEALYGQVPKVTCKGLCDDACGPIDMGPAERLRVRRAGAKIPPKAQADKVLIAEGHFTCPALQEGQCSVYEARPMICHLWGVMEDMTCPYGCASEVELVPTPEAVALIDAAGKVGTANEPMTAKAISEVLRGDPRMRAAVSALIRQPTATREKPPT